MGGRIADSGPPLVGCRAADIGLMMRAPWAEIRPTPNNAIALMERP